MTAGRCMTAVKLLGRRIGWHVLLDSTFPGNNPALVNCSGRRKRLPGPASGGALPRPSPRRLSPPRGNSRGDAPSPTSDAPAAMAFPETAHATLSAQPIPGRQAVDADAWRRDPRKTRFSAVPTDVCGSGWQRALLMGWPPGTPRTQWRGGRLVPPSPSTPGKKQGFALEKQRATRSGAWRAGRHAAATRRATRRGALTCRPPHLGGGCPRSGENPPIKSPLPREVAALPAGRTPSHASGLRSTHASPGPIPFRPRCASGRSAIPSEAVRGGTAPTDQGRDQEGVWLESKEWPGEGCRCGLIGTAPNPRVAWHADASRRRN